MSPARLQLKLNAVVLPVVLVAVAILDRAETASTAARYDRIASVFDVMEWLMERAAFRQWRARLWSRVTAGRVLEVGAGTGKKIEFYPRAAQVSGIHISPRMLRRARRRAALLRREVIYA